MQTVEKRSVEQVEGELRKSEDALLRLLEEQAALETRRVDLLDGGDDGVLEAAALAGRSLGPKSSLRQILDRLAELPSHIHVLKKRVLRLRLERSEKLLEQNEAERVQAIQAVQAALEEKLATEQNYHITQGSAASIENERYTLRQQIRNFRNQLSMLQQSAPNTTGGNRAQR